MVTDISAVAGNLGSALAGTPALVNKTELILCYCTICIWGIDIFQLQQLASIDTLRSVVKFS